MKKFYLFLTMIAVVMLVGLTNCKKTDLNPSTQYVEAIQGSFIPQDINVSVSKSVDPFAKPIATTRNWIMYAKNSPFYGNQAFALVKGQEFVTGSAAQIWWSTEGNNPISFLADQAVYSNLTPAEPVRLIMETKTGVYVAYLGILDFDPTQAQFPLTVSGKRLGDVLTIDPTALTKLPGANLTITVKFNLAPVDLVATEKGIISHATSGNATGVTGALDFGDIKYGTPVSVTKTVVNSNEFPYDFPLYSGTDSKVFGDIVITVSEAASASTPANTYVLTVPASKVGIAGKSTKLKLTTTKLGWYDSQTINTSDNDINVETVEIPVN